MNESAIRWAKRSGTIAQQICYAMLSLFVLSRIIVMAIMSGWLPSFLFLHVNGYHIHHYVYGIFILVALCTFLLFFKIKEKSLKIVSFCYGVGITLLFDEFVFWLTMGGSYYSKLSVHSLIILFCIFLGISRLHYLKKIGIDSYKEYTFVFIFSCIIALAVIFASSDIFSLFEPFTKQLDAGSPP